MPSMDYALRPQSEDQGFRDVIARIKLRLHQLGLNQTEFARRLGVSHASASGWLNLKFQPQFSIIPKLPGVLQCNGHWLLTGEGPATERPAGTDVPEMQGRLAALLEVRAAVETMLTKVAKQAPAPTKSAPAAS